jgi:Peptidase family M1.
LLNRTEQFQNGQKNCGISRETDPQKLIQLDTIFHQVFASIKWMEEYTGVPYPFAKYDLIILPGFQYGVWNIRVQLFIMIEECF